MTARSESCALPSPDAKRTNKNVAAHQPHQPHPTLESTGQTGAASAPQAKRRKINDFFSTTQRKASKSAEMANNTEHYSTVKLLGPLTAEAPSLTELAGSDPLPTAKDVPPLPVLDFTDYVSSLVLAI